MIYNFHIFTRAGDCIYYHEWNRTKEQTISQEEEFKLMYGMIYSIKSFAKRLAPKPSKEAFRYYKTNQYKLHFHETPTGLKLVLTTSPEVGDIDAILKQIYTQIYTEYVVRNPMCEPQKQITSELFVSKVDAYVKSLSIF